jgi:hypothetical protein
VRSFIALLSPFAGKGLEGGKEGRRKKRLEEGGREGGRGKVKKDVCLFLSFPLFPSSSSSSLVLPPVLLTVRTRAESKLWRVGQWVRQSERKEEGRRDGWMGWVGEWDGRERRGWKVREGEARTSSLRADSSR